MTGKQYMCAMFFIIINHSDLTDFVKTFLHVTYGEDKLIAKILTTGLSMLRPFMDTHYKKEDLKQKCMAF